MSYTCPSPVNVMKIQIDFQLCQAGKLAMYRKVFADIDFNSLLTLSYISRYLSSCRGTEGGLTVFGLS